jgi:hypothetical protein
MVLTGILGVVPPGHDTRRSATQHTHRWVIPAVTRHTELGRATHRVWWRSIDVSSGPSTRGDWPAASIFFDVDALSVNGTVLQFDGWGPPGNASVDLYREGNRSEAVTETRTAIFCGFRFGLLQLTWRRRRYRVILLQGEASANVGPRRQRLERARRGGKRHWAGEPWIGNGPAEGEVRWAWLKKIRPKHR